MTKTTVKALALLLLLIAVYYWKILFTGQFSLLTVSEGASQAYAWLHYWILSIRHGTLPLWDPYTFSGHPFAGEMQTQAFDPLHLLFLLVPLGANGEVLARAFEYWFVFVHFLGACFMFALARELGLGRFPAMVAGLCFSLGNFLAISSWPHFWETGIWLPLVLLFLLRALRAEGRRTLLRNAVLGGLSLGLAILAGGLHIAIMAAVVVVTAGIFAGFTRRGKGRWTVPALAVGLTAVVSFCAGAVQLFSSIEYSQVALRWITGGPAQPAAARIPYAYLGDHLWPQGIIGMLMPHAFGGNLGPGEVWAVPTYIGALPVLAAVIGIWKCWDRLWVRYLTGLAALAFLYSLGPFSLLHGLLYSLVPALSLAREADRFMFLASFALALLAGFGIEALVTAEPGQTAWRGVRRVLGGILAVCCASVGIAAVFREAPVDPLVWFSVLMIALSCGLLLYATRGRTGLVVKALIVALVLFDLNAFFPSAVNKIEAAQKNTNELEKLQSLRGAAEFLRSRPGPFRVEVAAEPRLNIGDMYRVQWVMGTGVSMLKDYFGLLGRPDLLNARYVVKPASTTEPGAVYEDSAWKVYENPSAFPRAWIVHETEVAPKLAGVDLRRVAVLGAPQELKLEPPSQGAAEDVAFRSYAADRMEMTVHASGRGLLVLSEVFYPGWRAQVDGRPARIYKVDGALRGIVVPGGESRVAMEYLPISALAGGSLTLAAFLVGLALAMAGRRKPESGPEKCQNNY
jgi:hypothetical protein